MKKIIDKINEDIIVTRQSNDQINFYGYKGDVHKAIGILKDNIIVVNEHQKRNLTKLVSITPPDRDVQWEYYIDDEWQPFSMCNNSLIDESFIAKKKTVSSKINLYKLPIIMSFFIKFLFFCKFRFQFYLNLMVIAY